MSDWSREWRDHVDAATAARVERAHVELDDLLRRWWWLSGQVSAVGGAGGGAEPVRRSVPGPRVPLRLDVVDLQRDIAGWTQEQVGLARGALRAGVWRGGPVASGLGFLLATIGPVWVESPETAEAIAAGAWSLRRRARRIAGEVASAFPLDVDCPGCGCLSLWVHPGRGLVRCGLDECGREWTAGALAVSVWRVESV